MYVYTMTRYLWSYIWFTLWYLDKKWNTKKLHNNSGINLINFNNELPDDSIQSGSSFDIYWLLYSVFLCHLFKYVIQFQNRFHPHNGQYTIYVKVRY